MMYILIKLIAFLTLLQISQFCSTRYYKHVNRKINKNNNIKYPWLVAIRSTEDLTIFKLSYGSLIHSKAVLTSAVAIKGYAANTLIVETKCKDIKKPLNKDNELGIYGCTSRHVSKVVYPTNSSKQSNFTDSYAILILKKPFNICSKINPISLAVNISNIDQNKCIFTRWMREWSNVTGYAGIINTPYKASLVNGSSSILTVNYSKLKTHRDWIVGKIFHLSHILDDEFSIIPLNFMGSPLACPDENLKTFVQVGTATFRLTIYINNQTNELKIKHEGSFFSIIHQKCEIMQKVLENVCLPTDQMNNI